MLGYSLRPEEHRPGVPPPYALGAEARMIEDIRAAASGGDAVLVSLHWGDEYVEYPSLAQMRFARRLVEAGADIIVGHHPHVVQGVERYRGAVIAYSLGNFVFDMWQRATRHSILLTVVLRGKGDLDHRVAPVWIGADHRPVASADLHPYRKAEVLFRRQADRLSLPAREQDRLDAEYRALARRRMRRNRYEDYAFFISRLLTYRPTYVCQSVSRSLGRRREQVAQALRGKGLPG